MEKMSKKEKLDLIIELIWKNGYRLVSKAGFFNAYSQDISYIFKKNNIYYYEINDEFIPYEILNITFEEKGFIKIEIEIENQKIYRQLYLIKLLKINDIVKKEISQREITKENNTK